MEQSFNRQHRNGEAAGEAERLWMTVVDDNEEALALHSTLDIRSRNAREPIRQTSFSDVSPPTNSYILHAEAEQHRRGSDISSLSFGGHPPETLPHKVITNVWDDQTHHVRPYKALWTPFWLRSSVLIAFALLFTLFWVALVILWHESRRQNGFALTLSHSHYAWTYGPTAVLVVVVSLWRQVDYACKYTQPWQEMKSSAPATKSLLLDYISPMQVVSFVESIRLQHWAVAASITAFALLKLIILFSTTLFTSIPTTKPKPVTVILASHFNGSNIWSDIVPAVSYNVKKNASMQYQLDETRTYIGISSAPIYAYLGVLQEETEEPLGTQGNFAFQIFNDTRETSDLHSVTAEVDVFESHTNCEIAEVGVNNLTSMTGYFDLTLDTPTCHLGFLDHSIDLLRIKSFSQACPEQSFGYSLVRHNCSNPSPITLFDYLNQSVPTDSSVGGDYRMMFITGNFTNRNLSDDQYNPKCESTVQSISGVVCKINYTMGRGILTRTIPDGHFDLTKNTSSPELQLDGLQSLQLTELIHSTAWTARDVFGYITTVLGDLNGASARDPIYGLMAKSQGSHDITPSSLEQFMDAAVLSKAASKVLNGIAVQMARVHAIESFNKSETSMGVYIEDRLHVRDVSLWMMVAGFSLLTVLALILAKVSPKASVPRDPGPVITSAAILAQSPELNKLLLKMGQSNNHFLHNQLKNTSCCTRCDSVFEIIVDLPDHHVPRKSVWQGFWVPIPLRYWMLGLTLLPPLLLIAVLEILFQASERNDGLATVLNESGSTSSALRYGSTLVVLLVATAFNALDFQISVFAPFQKLRSGDTSRSLLSHLIGQNPLFALYQSLQYRYVGALFSNVAALIGSLLTVIVSGLWIVGQSPHSQLVNGNTADTWNWTWPQSVMNDSGAAVTLNSIDRASAGNTTGTWGDFAFPQIAKLDTGDYGSDGNVSLTVPALRPILECTMISPERILIYNTTEPGSHPGSNIFTGIVSAYIELPSGCWGGPAGDESFTYFNQSFWTAGSPALFSTAVLLDLHLGPWPVTDSNKDTWLRFGESNDNLEQPDSPSGCPSLGIILGYLNTAFTPSQNITAAVCYQKLQQIQVKVTYNGPPEHSLIDPTISPLADESTSFFLTNGSEGVTSFSYRMEGHINNNLTLYDNEQPIYDGEQQPIDPFFDHIIRGPLSVPLEDMFSNSNKLLEAVDRMYRRYMVQVITANFRRPVLAGVGTAVNGTAIETISRLKVSETSKIVLQAMLAVMFLFAMLAISMSKIRNVLPHNPCSIAGTMALFAGSSICDKSFMPDDAAYMSKQEYKQLLDGYLFSLGWWEDVTGPRPRKRFGIDIGKSTALLADEDQKVRFRGFRPQKAKTRKNVSLTIQ